MLQNTLVLNIRVQNARAKSYTKLAVNTHTHVLNMYKYRKIS